MATAEELMSYVAEAASGMGVLELLSYAQTKTVAKKTPPSQQRKVEALYSYWAFIDLISFHGGASNFYDCHREMVEWACSPKSSIKQLVLEARGMLKSTCLGVGYALWRIYQNPNIRIFYGSSVLELSTAFIREIKEYLEDPWLIAHVWNSRPHFDGPLIPEMEATKRGSRVLLDFEEDNSGGSTRAAGKKVWRGQAVQVLRPRKIKEPTITAGSVGQVPTGFHFDELILDDVVTYKNCKTPELLRTVFSWINDLVSVLDDPYLDSELLEAYNQRVPHFVRLMAPWAINGRQRVIGTRYSKHDYYGFILDNLEELGFSAHVRNIYVNNINSDDGYRWPEKWNEKVEQAKKAALIRQKGSEGKVRFYSQYLNQILVPEDISLNWEKIKWYNPGLQTLEDDGFVVVRNTSGEVVAEVKPRIFVDPSSGGDYTSIAVAGRDSSTKHLYILDYWQKSCRSDVWMPKMFEMGRKWGTIKVASIEMVGGFAELMTTLQTVYFPKDENYVMLVEKYIPANNMNKRQRIEDTLGVLMHNEMVHAPFWISSYQDLQEQFEYLGSASVRDDGPDVWNQAAERAPAIKRVDKATKRNKSKRYVDNRFGGIVYG